MNQLTLNDFNVPGICYEGREALRALVGDGPFTPRDAARAYLEAGHGWTDLPKAYVALVEAGRLPESDLIWRIARIAFREASRLDGLRHLSKYASTLDARNWREARDAAYAAAMDAHHAYTAAYNAYAATTGPTALSIAAKAANLPTIYVTAYAAYEAACAAADELADSAAFYAAKAAAAAVDADRDPAAGAAARARVRNEVIEMVLGAVEAAPGE